MDDTFQSVATAAHGALVHFPLSLLLVSVVLDVLSLRRPALRQTAWYLLLLGTLGAVAAVISGLIVHERYEGSKWIDAIERHQWSAFATAALFIVLCVWRWRSARRDTLPSSAIYIGASLVGLVVLLFTGYLGGQLVYELGVGVRGISR